VIGQLLAGVVIGPACSARDPEDLLSGDAGASCATSAPGATTDFRKLDLANGGEILVVLVVAATSKLLAGGVSAAASGLSSGLLDSSL
jgi:hypothetical protein